MRICLILSIYKKMIVVKNRAIQDNFSMSQFCNFLGLKKGYIEMTEKIYLETFEKCAGSVHFPLLARSSIYCHLLYIYLFKFWWSVFIFLGYFFRCFFFIRWCILTFLARWFFFLIVILILVFLCVFWSSFIIININL